MYGLGKSVGKLSKYEKLQLLTVMKFCYSDKLELRGFEVAVESFVVVVLLFFFHLDSDGGSIVLDL